MKPQDLINEALRRLTTNRYFPSLPTGLLWDILAKEDLVPLQEDNTEWQGILCGRESRLHVPLAKKSTATVKDGITFYTPSKLWLLFSWYKMPSGRYEIVAYVS